MNKLQNKRIIFGALLGALFMILAFAAIPIAGAEPLRQDATPCPMTPSALVVMRVCAAIGNKAPTATP